MLCCLLSHLASYCILLLFSNSANFTPLSFAWFHPLRLPLSLLLLFPFQDPYGRSPSSSFMLNLFLPFIPHLSAFSSLYIFVFGGYLSSEENVRVCVRMCVLHCQTSCLKTEGIKIDQYDFLVLLLFSPFVLCEEEEEERGVFYLPGLCPLLVEEKTRRWGDIGNEVMCERKNTIKQKGQGSWKRGEQKRRRDWRWDEKE